ncbi:MAG: hypothetical protein QOG01_4619 [Pseudonocardiales bacterium]|jgi:hypothetical protein|nr:hypothetical protein [Pseudonocardiales bacterium]
MSDELEPVSAAELAAEDGTALPDKEVMSLLDLNANLDLALDVASPIDLAIGANANIAAPIDASVGANVLSVGSTAGAESLQAAEIHQGVTGDATATADQNSAMNQTAAPTGDTTTPIADTTTTPGDTSSVGSTLDGNLLNVNVDLTGDLNLAAPIDGAVAANANVAAPIDAAVSANVGSVDSDATAISHQSALITQDINGDATATADQTSTIDQ